MLKISILDTPSQRQLVMEGKLIGPWATELASVWRKCIHGDWSDRDFRHAVFTLRIRDPDGAVGNVHLILPHGQKFFVDPQTGLRKDAVNVAQALRAAPLNSLPAITR